MKIGIEMGGTKVIVASGSSPETLGSPIHLKTQDPSATLSAACDAASALQTSSDPVTDIGIAAFGPICVDPDSSHYGRLYPTPKPGWSHADLILPIRKTFPAARIWLDTDVNAAALAEGCWGAAKGMRDFAYVTVGTGIGVGLISNGKPVHGRMHPEAGHLMVRRHDDDHGFMGVCPFHGDCLEGLAAGPSLKARFGQSGEDLSDDHPIWGRIGDYLAQLCLSLSLISAPQLILFGGSIGLKPIVMNHCRARFKVRLNGYLNGLDSDNAIESYIAHASLGNNAGVLGAIALTGAIY